MSKAYKTLHFSTVSKPASILKVILGMKFDWVGLFAFSLNENILVCPDKQVGNIIIKTLTGKSSEVWLNPDPPETKTTTAHSTPLSFLEINKDGDLIATASEKVEFYYEWIIFSGNLDTYFQIKRWHPASGAS